MSVPVREVASDALTPRDVAGLRALFAAAWPDVLFDEHDFAHAMGGRHWLIEIDGRIVSHASVIERVLEAGGRRLRTGYVEAVATLPDHAGLGHGTSVLRAAGDHIRTTFELGALSTDRPAFYERLGWVRWRGPTFVRAPGGPVRTPDDDDGILVLPTTTSPALELTESLSCDWREGDVW